MFLRKSFSRDLLLWSLLDKGSQRHSSPPLLVGEEAGLEGRKEAAQHL